MKNHTKLLSEVDKIIDSSSAVIYPQLGDVLTTSQSGRRQCTASDATWPFTSISGKYLTVVYQPLKENHLIIGSYFRKTNIYMVISVLYMWNNQDSLWRKIKCFLKLIMHCARTLQIINSSSFLFFNFLSESVFNYSIWLASCPSVSIFITFFP